MRSLKDSMSTEYALQATTAGVTFVAYRGDTISATDPETARKNEEVNTDLRGYFLRKGFSLVLRTTDPDIATPIYKDMNGNQVYPESTNQAIDLIYDRKLNISGFSFTPKATEQQKEQCFAKMVDIFAETSKNYDLASNRYQFMVGMTNDLLNARTSWEGGDKVSHQDILKTLDLAPDGIQARKDYRQELFSRAVAAKSKTL